MKKHVIKNFFSLSLIKTFSICVPIVVYPLAMKILGNGLFGQVLVFQSFLLFFVMTISFGFNLTGAKEISSINSNVKIKRVFFKNISQTKFILLVLSSLLYLMLYFFVPNQYKIIYPVGFVYLWAEFFNSQWYFVGINKLSHISIISFVSKFSLVLFVYLIYRNNLATSVSYFLVSFLFALDYFLVSFYSFISAKNSINIRLSFLFGSFNFKENKKLLKSSSSVFSIVFITALKDRFNLVIVSILFSPAIVVVIDLSLKFLNILSLPSALLSMASFSSSSKNRDKIFFYNLLLMSFTITLVGYILFFFLLPFANDILFHFNTDFYNYIYIITFSALFLSISCVLANNAFISTGNDRVLLYNVAFTTGFYFIALFCFYLSPFKSNLMGLVTVISLTYLFEMVLRLFTFFIFLNKRWSVEEKLSNL
ncbi:oligosaccharide flippase family protein [Photobacterium phosphoreum]|uniref:Polysaccharide biosynthesis protein n=2 Tax=Photobacterium phosphoreum TaxID=659 RepID=A0A2T3JG35_PHOPO|nr:oligosaccharide flippase family protein [Photobacterium phosphoreum]PSU47797.1 hypothetical protein C9J18_18410 [Photobacterium phosphoreum]